MTSETLADLALRGDISISTGPFGSALHAHDYRATGVAVVPTEAISPRGLLHDRLVRISREKARELERHTLQEGDIVFARRGVQACGISTRISPNDGEAIAGTGVITLRIHSKNKIDPGYLACAVGSTDSIRWLKHHAIGATMPNLNSSVILSLPINLPPISEQRAIAHILGTLDDKIELNRKQNETLEAMARTLFKAWFVDFEPVRTKLEGRWQRGLSLPGLPAHLYDIFPDRLVESELGEIPEGWRVFAFGDVAQQGKGVVNPGNSPQDLFTHYSLPAFDSAQTPSIEPGDGIKSNKTPVPDGAVLVSKLNPHIPRVWHVGTAGANAVCSTEFIVWTPKAPANSAFLYCLASSPEFNSAMRQLVTGTSNSHQRVKPDQLGEIRIFAATEYAIEAFSELVRSSLEQILQNRQESRTLAQLRDTLLPKLISGELRIADADRFIAHAERNS